MTTCTVLLIALIVGGVASAVTIGKQSKRITALDTKLGKDKK